VKRQTIFLAGFLILTLQCGFSQVDEQSNWSFGGKSNLLFSQLSMTNWAAGGEDAVSVTGALNLNANYTQGKANWENGMNLAYGLLRQGSDPTRKSDDRIEISSKYGYARSKWWFYSGEATFKTQFSPGYNLPDDSTIVSDFMAPGYLSMSLGMDYKIAEKFTAMFSPFSGKITFVQNQDLANAGAFGVTPATYDSTGLIIQNGETNRAEFGALIKIGYNRVLWENVDMTTKLGLFTNYFDKPQNVDVNWEMVLNLKVNEYLSTHISAQFVYDDNTRFPNTAGRMVAKPQFKEILGVGLNYQF